jgi:hypothetical protein
MLDIQPLGNTLHIHRRMVNRLRQNVKLLPMLDHALNLPEYQGNKMDLYEVKNCVT